MRAASLENIGLAIRQHAEVTGKFPMGAGQAYGGSSLSPAHPPFPWTSSRSSIQST